MLRILRAGCTLSALAGLGGPASAQHVKLSTPNASLAEEFSSIRGVRELADGRLLVSDYIDQRVVLVDLARKSLVSMVTKGGGPREARLPTRLVPAQGDSTLLVDLGNNRLLLLDGAGRPVRTIPAEGFGFLGVRGVDAAGAFYYAVPGWADQAAQLANDSVRVVRWSPRTGTTETVAVVQGERMRSDIRQPARTPRIPTVGYASQDGWLLSDTGVLRIVRAGGYRIESRGRGAPLIGPSYAYQTPLVSSADRVAYVREFLATTPTSGKGENGGMGFSPAASEAEIAAMTQGTQFAERHPMFDAGRVVAAAGGRLWVGHPALQGKPVLYDEFDEAGRRLRTIELLPGRRVLSIGRQGVYVVAESELGVQHLERYPLP
ncbi:MAG TPA: hypothetical protein VL241_03175 [Gemmatimonadales bacterium]|nr:hypothetical protein [Gemmatimonadales bacterium]